MLQYVSRRQACIALPGGVTGCRGVGCSCCSDIRVRTASLCCSPVSGVPYLGCRYLFKLCLRCALAWVAVFRSSPSPSHPLAHREVQLSREVVLLALHHGTVVDTEAGGRVPSSLAPPLPPHSYTPTSPFFPCAKLALLPLYRGDVCSSPIRGLLSA